MKSLNSVALGWFVVVFIVFVLVISWSFMEHFSLKWPKIVMEALWNFMETWIHGLLAIRRVIEMLHKWLNIHYGKVTESTKDTKSCMNQMHYGKVMETLKEMKSSRVLTCYGKVM